MEVLGGGGSYERGTPVRCPICQRWATLWHYFSRPDRFPKFEMNQALHSTFSAYQRRLFFQTKPPLDLRTILWGTVDRSEPPMDLRAALATRHLHWRAECDPKGRRAFLRMSRHRGTSLIRNTHLPQDPPRTLAYSRVIEGCVFL